MKVSNVTEMRAMDRCAVERFGIADQLLMENAGLAAYSVLSKKVGIRDKKILVFCGLGNNGGDGFVVARKIFSDGGSVKVFILGDRRKFKDSAKANLDIISGMAIEIRELKSAESIAVDLDRCDAVVDAIFGTGLSKDVQGLHREVIEMINQSAKPALSLDIPSGVHGDTAQIMGIAVKADYTVTFGLPKIGNLLYPGYDSGGRLFVSHISFPPSIHCSDSLKIALNSVIRLPARDKSGHKGTFGQALFIAGASNYFGAPYFAAAGFMKAGGGYSRLAAPESMIPFIAGKAGELVLIPQKETPTHSIALENKTALLELAEKMDMVVIGPGLSLDPETCRLVRALVPEIRKPLLLDGDGITAVCENPDCIKKRTTETILTPHMGEMSRITGQSIRAIDADKINLLQQTCSEWGAYIVLKGAHSLIGYPDERIYINMSGNCGMATAGSGDVLSGTIAAMFGLGLKIPDAVRKGVFIHGLAGDIVADAIGEDGLTAQDVLEALPAAMKLDREGRSYSYKSRYAGAEII